MGQPFGPVSGVRVSGGLSEPLIPQRESAEGRDFVGGRRGLESREWTGVGEETPAGL